MSDTKAKLLSQFDKFRFCSAEISLPARFFRPSFNLLARWNSSRLVPAEFHSTSEAGSGKSPSMAESDETRNLSWPWWAPWALLAVAVTSVLTVAATLYDIL